MGKYTLETGQDGHRVIKEDGKAKSCPFMPPVVAQVINPLTQKPEISATKYPCTSECALFQIHRGESRVQLKCSTAAHSFIISK